MYTYASNGFIPNSQKSETAQGSINWQMAKQNVVEPLAGHSPLDGLWFSYEKEQRPDSCYSVDETQKHYAKIQEAIHERSHFIWLHLYEMSRARKSRVRTQVGSCGGLRREGGRMLS